MGKIEKLPLEPVAHPVAVEIGGGGNSGSSLFPGAVPSAGPDPATIAQALAAASGALAQLAASLVGSPLPPSPGRREPENSTFPAALAAPPALSLSVPLGQVLRLFADSKERAGRSEKYVRLLRWQVGVLSDRLGSVPAGSLRPEQIERVLERVGCAAVTRRGLFLTLRCALAWGARRGYLAGNPCGGVDVPTVEPSAPVVHAPVLVAESLRIAFARDADLGRALAIRYFAGLRRSEVERLGEADVREGVIVVPARAAKTRARRVVRIQPALEAWLQVGGRLGFRNANDRWTALSHALPAAARGGNGPRHSFCSYHLAAFNDAALTALEAGHTEAVLFRVYREIVPAAVAWEFWSLRP